ncbi:hypothetical protein BDF14DRAFT_1743920 [Spinellus fusiger]|nr:hypothetical protein BDF14DRAFT_1743920 [Spinellus fusiger]
MDLAASLLGRLLQCSIKTCSGESSQCHSLDVRTIVHCLVVYVAWPTKAEDIAHVEKGHWPSQVWVDSEEQAFCYLEARVVLAYESLFALLLECLIQTIQNTSDATVNRLARSTAVCVQALWTCLLKETAPVSLSGRLEKLGVYLLHYSDAVDQWSNAPSHLQSLVWQPTLVQAKQGLALICHSSPKEMLPAGHPYVSEKETPQHTPLHASLLSKAKRAFAALEKASHHPRACERLVDEDCLSLVSMAWIPTNTQLGYSVETLTVYSLFIRFIASLVSKTAYVRIKLREECTVIPMILHLLDLSTKARESDSLKRQQWNRVIVWSLKVIHAFQFDMASLQAWITWKGLNDREILVSVDQALTSSPHQGSLYNKEGSTNSLLSILRDVLILTPSTVSDKEEEIWKRDEQVMTTATLLLDTLTLLPEFGLQIMESDPPMMESLGKLLLLMTQVSSCPLPLSLIDTTETCTTSLVSLQALQRSLTRLVTYKETLSVFVRLDLWMLLFRPTLLHRPMDIYWRDYFCQQLHTKCLEDLWRLFQFTLNDNAIVLNEMCAIAIAYACMDPQHWSLLVDVATEENILDENCIMGVISLQTLLQ